MHWRLLQHASRLEQSQSNLRWLDLYTVQALVDLMTGGQVLTKDRQTTLSQAAEDAGTVDLLLACSSASSMGYLALTVEAESYQKQWELLRAQGLRLPDVSQLEAILNVLNAHALMQSADEGSSDSPLVLDDGSLYLRRIWEQRQVLLQWRAQHEENFYPLQSGVSGSAQEEMLTCFRHLFPEVMQTDSGGEIDWQAVAAAQALTQSLTLVSGGPGTGKTSTAARILILLQLQGLLEDNGASVAPARVRLLAPTGKAAVRLQSAIAAQYDRLVSGLPVRDELKATLRASNLEEGETIHRAILSVRGAHQRERLIPDEFVASESLLLGKSEGALLNADIVLIDEASMIDQKLMVDLVQLLPSCRVVVMGDHYQLPPVESGEVFSEWVEHYRRTSIAPERLQEISRLYGFAGESKLSELRGKNANCGDAVGSRTEESKSEERKTKEIKTDESHEGTCLLAQLYKTYRFSGPIYEFAQGLKSGKLPHLEALLPVPSAVGRCDAVGDLLSGCALNWVDLDLANRDGGAQVALAQAMSQAMAQTLEGYRHYFDLVRQEASAQSLLQEKARYQILCASYEGKLGVHNLNRLVERRFVAEEIYHGKVIMVTANQPELNLFNGDVGVLIRQQSEQENDRTAEPAYVVEFSDHPDQSVSAPLAMIHHWQTAYAMSIHKSQGSEYEKVSVFAPDYARELLTRRLVYTGITRSQKSVELWISKTALEAIAE